MEETSKNNAEGGEELRIIPVDTLYENWFIDYASYVILERAVPAINDGLKPVQRRILHAMKEMDDGRFNKVANIIGQTMQYHPHGDAAIGDAMVKMGQKDLMIETQGNWGDIRTGDRAAASRYIEARLSKLALEIAYHPDLTEWQLSYDGRKKEPVTLPVKFPLLLAHGAEGIAVGLSTKILPHNFIELCKASIDYLKGRSFKLFPDFPTGGLMDVAEYNQGKRGGRVKVRAKIEVVDKKTLAIKEIPFSTTTETLIESILKANEKGKIKIKKVVDNTAQDVEILIDLPPEISTSVAIDALYAFTDCQVSISPLCCVIKDDKPLFTGVHDILKISTDQTVALLKKELEIYLNGLEEKWHFSSLEKIFIENRIYRDIEECETWEAVIEAIDKGLDPFKAMLMRDVTVEDITRLTEIKIKRISKFDAFKADELIKKLEEDMATTRNHLANLIEYAVAYFQNLMDKYGKGRERLTTITEFDVVEAKEVVVANQKLYVDKAEGFVGIGRDMKKGEYVTDCSDIDDIIAFTESGTYKIVRAADKIFVGKNIIHVGVWRKGDERMTYNAIYRDGKTGKSFAKRFNVTSITRDKEYDVTQGKPNSKLLYFSANENGEAEVITIKLTLSCTAKKKIFDYYFSELDIKGRGANGITVTKYPIKSITLKESGVSTLGGLDIWIDESVGRLNKEGRGRKIGNFMPDSKLLVIYKSGEYEMLELEMTQRFNLNDIIYLGKFNFDSVITAIHYVEDKKCNFIKRFKIETTTTGQRFKFIGEETKDKLVFATISKDPEVEYTLYGNKNEKGISTKLAELIDVKGWKSVGNKLIAGTIRTIKEINISTAVEEEVAPKVAIENETEEDDSDETEQIDLTDKVDIEDENSDDEPKEEVKEAKPIKDIDFEITNLNGDSVQGELF
jgi:topoisomerase-4 subunit A